MIKKKDKASFRLKKVIKLTLLIVIQILGKFPFVMHLKAIWNIGIKAEIYNFSS